MTFVERTIGSLSKGLNFATLADDSARARSGALQRVDPRVKVVGMLAMIVSVAVSHNLLTIACVFLIATSMASASRISLVDMARWVWTPVLLFTGCIALPAIFVTPGAALYGPITIQGVRTAGFLLLRAETCAGLSTLLVLTTRWAHILKALRVLRMPVVFVVILISDTLYGRFRIFTPERWRRP